MLKTRRKKISFVFWCWKKAELAGIPPFSSLRFSRNRYNSLSFGIVSLSRCSPLSPSNGSPSPPLSLSLSHFHLSFSHIRSMRSSLEIISLSCCTDVAGSHLLLPLFVALTSPWHLTDSWKSSSEDIAGDRGWKPTPLFFSIGLLFLLLCFDSLCHYYVLNLF